MKSLFAFVLVLSSSMVFAQQIHLKGSVKDSLAQPISEVNVYLVDSFYGSVSDSNGNFEIIVPDSIVQESIRLIHKDFLPIEQTIYTTTDCILSFTMVKDPSKLEEILISLSPKKKEALSQSISFTAMDVVSTASSPGNIIGLVSNLPSGSTNPLDGRLLIRGGDASETNTYINGVKVFSPYSPKIGNTAVRSKFNPFIFKGMSFSSGGYSAEFGEALSGILDLQTLDDLGESRKDYSVSSVGISAGTIVKGEGNAYSVHLNYLNLSPYNKVIKQSYQSIKPFESLSLESSFQTFFKDGGYKLFTQMEVSKVKIIQDYKPNPIVDTLSLQSYQGYINSYLYKNILPFLKLEVSTGIGLTKQDQGLNNSLMNLYDIDLLQKVKLSYSWSNYLSSFVGVEYQKSISTIDFKEALLYDRLRFDTNRFSAFVQNNWQINNDLSLELGIRATKYPKVNSVDIQPRTLLKYSWNTRESLGFSYGKFTQNFDDKSREIILKQPDVMKVEHYIVRYNYSYKRRFIQGEVFYKNYNRLALASMENNHEYFLNGKGYVKGFDALYKSSNKSNRFKYWISYTFLDSKRKALYWQEYLQPDYIYKHNLSLVSKYWIDALKSQLSVTYNYSSPRKIYNPYELNPTSYITSQVNNISFSWAYLLKAQKIIYLSVDNLLGLNPVYGYTFSPNNNHAIEQRPVAKRFIYIGFMWTASKDKKSNQLENL